MLEQAGPLPDHLPLWRYMKLQTLFLLMEGISFFPSIAKLRSGDPLEGDLHPDAIWLSDALAKLHGAPASNELDDWLVSQASDSERDYQDKNKNDPTANTLFLTSKYLRELAKRRAVWCWFASDIESAGMWSIYGRGGVAVGTTLGALKKSLPSTRHFQISRIRYAGRGRASFTQFNPEAPEDIPYIHRPHFVKGMEYKHEQEVRVATFCHGQKNGTTVRDIDADTLIREIVLSPIWKHREAKAVANLLQKHQWKQRPIIRTSDLLGDLPDQEDISDRFDEFFKQYEYTEDGVPQLMREL